MSKKKTLKISKPRLHATKQLLDIDGLSLNLSGEQVLDNLSFCIHEGEFIGLIGPNGAGKTTLLKTMLGILPADLGIINKEDFTVGYVPQRGVEPMAQVPLSVLEIVKLGTKGDTSSALEALREVRLLRLAKKRFNELSGGQRQRVLIAKALGVKPKLLILDEPTTGIDEKSQSEFYAILHKLQAKGITIVMVSHDVDEVLKLVTRVICLNQKIVYDGPPEHFEADQYLPTFYTARHQQLHHHHKGSHV